MNNQDFDKPQEIKKPSKKRMILNIGLTVALVAVAGFLFVQRDNLVTFLGGVPGAIPQEGEGVKMYIRPTGSLATGSILETETASVEIALESLVENDNKDVPIQVVSGVLNFPKDKVQVVDFFSAEYNPGTLFDIGVSKALPSDAVAYQAALDEINSTGTISFNIARGLNEEDHPYALVGQVDFQPVTEGSVDLSLSYGDSRGSGPSLVLAEDENGNPVDVLDAVEGASFSVTSAVPRVDRLENELVNTTSSKATTIIMAGRNFNEDTVVLLSDPTDQYTPLHEIPVRSISQGGGAEDKIAFDVPVNVEFGPANRFIVRARNGDVTTAYQNTVCCVRPAQPGSPDMVPSVASVEPATSELPITEDAQFTVAGENLHGTSRVKRPDYINLLSDSAIYSLRNAVPVIEGEEVTTNFLVGDAQNIGGIQPGIYDLHLVTPEGYSTVMNQAVSVAKKPTVVVEEFFPDKEVVGYDEPIVFEASLGSNFDVENIALALVSGEQAYDLTDIEVTYSDDPVVVDQISIAATGQIPTGLPLGQYDLRITAGDVVQESENAFEVTEPVLPTIESFAPSFIETGYELPLAVSVDGSWLGGDQATFELLDGAGNVVAAIGNIASELDLTQVEGTLDSAISAGTYSLRLTRTDGITATLQDALSIVEPDPAPSITGVSPASVPEGQISTTELTVTGASFNDASIGLVAGEAAVPGNIVSQGETSIVFTPAESLDVGAYQVVVTNTDGQTATFDSLTVTEDPKPSVAGFTPLEIDEANSGNRDFEVSGTSFYPDSQVRLVSGENTVELSGEVVNEAATSVKSVISDFIAAGSYAVEVYSDAEGHVAQAPQVFTVNESPVTVAQVTLQSYSDGSKSKTLEASWTSDGGDIDFYQYRILRNGEVLRDWEDDRIQTATSFSTQDFDLTNNETYEIQVRAAVAQGEAYLASEPASSGEFTIRSGNIDRDAGENVNFRDLIAIFQNWGTGGDAHADINQDGKVNFTDIREWRNLR